MTSTKPASSWMTNPVSGKSILEPSSTVLVSGKNISYHPKPEVCDMPEWFELLRLYYTQDRRIVSNMEIVIKFVDTHEPYPLKREVESRGVDVTWHSY